MAAADNKPRNQTFDVVKGIAIILMVIGHAGCNERLRLFIYLFHMPVFFLIAGWFYKANFSWSGARKFVGGKLTRLWWPFVFWCSLFALLHNALLSWNVYPDVAHVVTPPQSRVLFEPWPTGWLLKTLLEIVLLQGGNYLLVAPLWFLQVLFFASLLYFAGDFSLSCIRLEVRSRRIVLALAAMLVLCATRYLHIGKLIILESHLGGAVVSTAALLVAVGSLLRNLNPHVDGLRGWKAGAGAIVSVVLLAGMSRFGTLELCANEFPSILFMLGSSLVGSFMLLCVASLGGGWRPALAYVGRHTMSILILHVGVFRIINWIVVTASGEPSHLIGSSVVFREGLGWCVLYVMVGVLVPLALGGLWQWIRTRVVRPPERKES